MHRKRPKHIFNKTLTGVSIPATTPDEYGVYASYIQSISGRCHGTLTVVRKTDNRILFPFAGAPELGPFDSKDDALRAAEELGQRIVAGDLADPEL